MNQMNSKHVSYGTFCIIAVILLLIIFPMNLYAEEVTNDYGYFEGYGYDPYYQNPYPAGGYTETETATETFAEEPETESETISAAKLKEPDENLRMTADISGKIHVLKMESGEGKAVLIESGGKYALIDTGKEESAAIIREQLWELGVTELSFLVLSDDDPGHTGGISYLMDNFRISRLYIPENVTDESDINTTIIPKAQEDGVEISNVSGLTSEALGRLTVTAVCCRSDAEAVSPCGFYISDDYGNTAFLAGNITNADGGETRILQEYPELSSIDFLIPGHYGKEDASSYAFIQYLDPGCCIVPGSQLANIENFNGTRAEQNNNIFFASGMAVSLVLGDVLNVECISQNSETDELIERIYNVYTEEESIEPPSATYVAEAEEITQSEEAEEPEASVSPQIQQEEQDLHENSEDATTEESDAGNINVEEPPEEQSAEALDVSTESEIVISAEDTGVISTGIPDIPVDEEDRNEPPTVEILQDEPGAQEREDVEVMREDDAVVLVEDTQDDQESIVEASDPDKQYFTVSFDTGGRGIVPDVQTVEAGSIASDPGSVESEGLTFTGWFSDKALKNYYSFNTPVTEDITLYARWSVNSYKILFDPNGGSGTMQPQEVSYGKQTELKTNAFSKDGSTFSGWCTAADGSGTWYSDRGNIYSLSSVEGDEITLYAQWKEAYSVISGNGQRINPLNGDSLEFTLTGTTENLNSIVLDGRLLDTVGYAVWGDTEVQVRISDAVTKTLSRGEHSIIFRFKDYELSASFIIHSGLPGTGDTQDVWKWIIITISSAFVMFICAILILKGLKARR